jgi:hypothetical protein
MVSPGWGVIHAALSTQASRREARAQRSMRRTRHPFLKCRKCGTFYFRINVAAIRDMKSKTASRICGETFERRSGQGAARPMLYRKSRAAICTDVGTPALAAVLIFGSIDRRPTLRFAAHLLCFAKGPHNSRSVLAFQPPDDKMAASHALKMIHENHVHRGATDGSQKRQCARGRSLANNDAA